jgi:hypothetical protein
MMTTGTAAMATSQDGFHATASAQRSDELVRAFFAAVNDDDDERIDSAAARSFLSYDIHGTRSRTGFKRYVSELHRAFSGLHLEVHENIGVLVEGAPSSADRKAVPSRARNRAPSCGAFTMA